MHSSALYLSAAGSSSIRPHTLGQHYRRFNLTYVVVQQMSKVCRTSSVALVPLKTVDARCDLALFCDAALCTAIVITISTLPNTTGPSAVVLVHPWQMSNF